MVKADDDPGIIPVCAGWHLFQSSICNYVDQAAQVGRAGDDIATAGANNIDFIVGANEALVAADEIDIGRANDAAQIANRLGNVLGCFFRESCPFCVASRDGEFMRYSTKFLRLVLAAGMSVVLIVPSHAECNDANDSMKAPGPEIKVLFGAASSLPPSIA